MDKIDWHAVKVLARKEIHQVLHHKQTTGMMVIASIAIFVVLPLIGPVLTLLGYAKIPLLEGVRFTASVLLPMFFYYPPALASAFATDSFAGEKERKTIETLLLLPCSYSALIISKVIVAITMVFIVMIGGFLSLGIVLNISIASHGIMIVFNEIEWYITVFLAAPLFTIINILCGILASIIARDVKSAQYLSMIPIYLMFFVMMSIVLNSIVLTSNMLFMFSGVCVLFDIGAAWLCIRFMDRERFLLQVD
jgi:ABC-type Na+ efflux pump permease subunit